MNGYTLIVSLHIAAAVLLLGTSILGEPVVRAAVRRATGSAEVRGYLRLGRPLARLSPMAALLVLATGAYLSSAGRFWGTAWVQVAVGFWLVNTVLAIAVVRPATDRLEEESGRVDDGPLYARLDDLRWSAAWTWGGDVMAANDAAMLFLMTLKPGLGGSLATVFLANALVAGGRAVMGARRRPAPA